MSKNTARTSRTTTIRRDHFERLREKTHVLYRCFNGKKRLLYVGMTNDPAERFRQHSKDKIWWRYVDHITLQRLPSRKDLAAAEAAAIAAEKPQFNIVVPRGYGHVLGKSKHVWPEASTFGVVTPDYGFLIDMTIEQQLYPCVECRARAIYCEGETVSCGLCASQWTFDQWFNMTFQGIRDTPAGTQMTLL